MKKGVFRFSFLIAVVLAGIFAASCATSKKFTYLMNMQLDSAYVATKAPETRFQVDDRLAVRVFCDEPELARPFNLTTGSDKNTHDASYLVENDGCIDFPVIGRVPVEGCTFKECENRIAGKIAEMGYIKNPVVNVSLETFNVTVIGETTNSVLKIEQDRVNLLQVIAMSAGVNIEGNINQVIVVRTENGMRTAHTVDLQSAKLFDSPVFYLKQNDIVYIKPTGFRITPTGETVFSILGSAISFATLTAYIMVLLGR